MEFENIQRGVILVIVGIVAYFSLFGYYNLEYGSSLGNSSQNTYDRALILAQTNAYNTSILVGNNTNTPSGAGSTSTNTDLVSRSLSIITAVPMFTGLIPALFQDAGEIFGLSPNGQPSIYVQAASWMFIFSFAILFAYLLIIGVRRLL